VLREAYGWSDDTIDELTYEQIRLHSYLAWKLKANHAKLIGYETAVVVARMMGG
jgi:hypothetical protein